jgi:hypothetical protein
MTRITSTLIAALCVLASSAAVAQTRPAASTVGAKVSSGGSIAGGTAGSAAAGGTSASTVGVGASSIANSGRSAVVAGAGSAAAVQGRATSSTRIRENPQILRAQSRAMAMDGGTWSRSMSNTSVRQESGLRSWTRSMAHEPGSKPVMSTTRIR